MPVPPERAARRHARCTRSCPAGAPTSPGATRWPTCPAKARDYLAGWRSRSASRRFVGTGPGPRPVRAAALIMRVCVVGAGGREHALALVLARTADVVVTPGNPGIPGPCRRRRSSSTPTCTSSGPRRRWSTGWPTACGPGARLVFGPGADGARLEGSKAWMKEVLVAAGVPTAAHRSFGAGEVDAAVGLPAHAARAVRREDRRAGRRQGRARHRRPRRGRSTTCGPSCPAPRSVTPGAGLIEEG